MDEVALVRHGETDWSRALRHTGRTDIPLNENGRRQARKLAARLTGRSFSRVLTSPLGRAAETCRLAGFADQAAVTPDLVEWDYGEYEGVTTAEIHASRPHWLLWRDGCPQGERAIEVGARVDRVLDELRPQEGSALLFAHGHLLRVLAARWLRLAPESGALFALSAGSLSLLTYEHAIPVIGVWNS